MGHKLRLRSASGPSIFLAALLLGPSVTTASVALPSLFSDHAVLTRKPDFQLWGTASPGEEVSVALDQAKGQAVANSEGKWALRIDLSQEGDGPYELSVEASNRLVIHDVAIGEVWVCSGQSNMEWAVQATHHGAAELALPPNRSLRLFAVTKTMAKAPMETCGGHWVVAGPDTVGPFSGVGYYFGKQVQAALGRPVGVIQSAWSGTPIEPWIPLDSLNDESADLKRTNDEILRTEAALPARMAAYLESYRLWQDQFSRADRPYAAAAILSDPPGAAGWRPVHLPGSLATQGFAAPGAVWVRRQLRVPPVGLPGIETGAILYLPGVHDFDTVFWDGTEVGHTAVASGQARGGRRYVIPRRLLKAGEDATIAIRIFSPADSPGLVGSAANFAVGTNIFDPGQVSLSGQWEAKAEYSFEVQNSAAEASYPKPPKRPGLAVARIFNAMINPLTKFAISGVVWYQGESNAGAKAYQYRDAFSLLISSWREHWNEGPFPFYFCQLANHGVRSTLPGESAWAELQESQSLTLDLPNTGEAVLIDLGVASDEHPRNKLEVGDRLARVALARTYGQTIPWSGPVFASSHIEGKTIRITFDHAEGLVARVVPNALGVAAGRPGASHADQPLEGFAVCGRDRKWVWASARIEANGVVVWSPSVPAPLEVRYAWAENPACNLYNAAGLPAAPFRTDNFPGLAGQRRF